MATLKSIKNKYLTASDGTVLGVTTNTENISLLSFKLATADSLSKFNLVDGFSDDYNDATGIDASGSTDEVRSANNYYSGSFGPVVTGGTITTDGSYTIHSFSQAQSGTDYVTDTAQTIDYLIVAGGGGGGYLGGAGGGAGGYRSFTSIALASGTFAVVVGAGGAGNPNSGTHGTPGSVSSFNSQTSAGGGGGSNYNNDGVTGGSGGGGGGGGGYSGGAGNTPSTSPSQGYAGGSGTNVNSRGGGGGGAGATGANGGTGTGGAGGIGVSNSITGTATYYAGGGGGASDSSNPAGGQGGGGQGGSEAPGGPGPTAGTDGLGGGGGGSRPYPGQSPIDAGDGGDGIVIVRRPTADGYNNMTLASDAYTAQADPTTIRIMMDEYTSTGSATLNTDIKAYASRDNGTTYTQITLANQGTIETTHRLLSGSVDISGQPSGTSVKYKIETLNQTSAKQTRVYGTSMAWA